MSTLVRFLTPLRELEGHRLGAGGALYAAWIALVGQPTDAATEAWPILVLDAVSPLIGLVLVGEGVVRFGLLMVSRRRGEKEWMKVMASTYRNHVVLCGLGHLGFRVLEQLLKRGADVVAIERDPACRYLAQAKGTGIPVLVRDMKDDLALIDAGVRTARAIVIASNDDMANIEVALDARRMNPGIRVLMRMLDQQVATKIREVFAVDAAFSASALAAPVIAAMTGDVSVLASFTVAGVDSIPAEVTAGSGLLAGLTVAEAEARYHVGVLALTRGGHHSPPATGGDTVLAEEDGLVVSGLAEPVSTILGLVAPPRGRARCRLVRVRGADWQSAATSGSIRVVTRPTRAQVVV